MANEESLDIGIDLGTTSVTVAYALGGSDETYLLQFESVSAQKDSNELPATFVRSQEACRFGPKAHVYSGILFRDVKLGISGRQPYRDQLLQALRKAKRELHVRETPVSLLTHLLQYILSRLKDQILARPETRGLLADRSFESIRKRCWITYPVRQNEPLRISLVEAALAADIQEVYGVSESIAAVQYFVLRAERSLPSPSVVLLIDCGGGSTDAAVVQVKEVNGQRRIRLVCPTDGFSGGGQTVNEAAREWYEKVHSDGVSWEKISNNFDYCKWAFDGKESLNFYAQTKDIRLDLETMESFHQDLISNVVNLVKTQYALAEEHGHKPTDIVLGGGPARNEWFRGKIAEKVKLNYKEVRFHTVTNVGAVAEGALIYARCPLTEPQVARANIGLEYLEDRHPDGFHLYGDEVRPAIGWVIEKGQKMGAESQVVFLETIYRDKPDRPNHIISTRVYATTEQFDQCRIAKNERIAWDCSITYPLEGVRHALDVLGIVEAAIPHDILFPPGSAHREIEAKFPCTVKQEGQLLRLQFMLEKDNVLHPLHRALLPDAILTDESELKYHKWNTPSAHRLKRSNPARPPGKRRRSIWDPENTGHRGRALFAISRHKAPKPSPQNSTDLPRSPAVLRRKLHPHERGTGTPIQPGIRGSDSLVGRSPAGAEASRRMSISAMLSAGSSLGLEPPATLPSPERNMQQSAPSLSPTTDNSSVPDSADEEDRRARSFFETLMELSVAEKADAWKLGVKLTSISMESDGHWSRLKAHGVPDILRKLSSAVSDDAELSSRLKDTLSRFDSL